MRPLVWSRMKTGLLNGKVGKFTLCTVGYHTHTSMYIACFKMPGFKPVHKFSEEEAKKICEQRYKQFAEFITGEIEWT